MFKNTESISQIKAGNQWAEGLDDSAFIFQCHKRKLEPSKVVDVLGAFPSIQRSMKVYNFFISMNPNAMDLYSFINIIENNMIVASFFTHIKNISFPPSMMAWLLKKKKWLDNPQAIEVFLELKPSATDYCWVFTQKPELQHNQKMLSGFLETNPTDSYIDYLARVVKFDDKALNFAQSSMPFKNKKNTKKKGITL